MALTAYLEKFHEWTKALVENSKVYYDKLEVSGFSGIEPYLAEKIQNVIQDVGQDTRLIKTAHDALKQQTPALYFEVYAQVQARYQALKEIGDIFRQNRIELSKQGTFTSSGTSLTYTYLQDLNDTLATLLNGMENLQLEMRKDVVGTLLLQDVKLIASLHDVETITKLYRKYLEEERANLIIDFYCRALQHAIRECTNNSSENIPRAEAKEILRYITQTVEELKTQVLEVGELQEIGEENRQNNAVQRLIQKYNLIPDAPSRPIADLLDAVFSFHHKIKAPSTPEEEKTLFTALARQLNIEKGGQRFGLIIIHKIVNQPYEHNIWTIIDRTYLEANNLWQGADLGVNDKAIQRTNTLFPRENAQLSKKGKDKSAGVDFYIEHFGEKDNFFYVLETLDGQNFRLLVPWHLGTEKKIYSIPAIWLQNLKDAQQAPSRRLQAYNLVLNNEIMKYAQKPLVQLAMLSRDEIQKEEGQWRGLRGNIKRRIMEIIRGAWEEIFEEKAPSTWGQLDKMISDHNTTFAILVVDTMVEHIKLETGITSTITSSILREQVHAELLYAYFRDLDRLQRHIGKDIQEHYLQQYQEVLKRAVGGSISSTQLLTVRNKVIDIYDNLMAEILEKYVNRKSNIYLSITNKLELLEKSLMKIVI